MEVIIGIIALSLALAIFLEKATNFFKALKSSGSAVLNKGLEVRLLLAPVHKESETNAQYNSSTSNETDE